MEQVKVNLDAMVDRRNEHNGPIKAYFGTMPAGQIKRWYDEHGDRLFDQNIRKSLGVTRVNQGLITTLQENPEHFWYWVVLDEVIVRRVVGDEDAMRGQLAHLLKLIGEQRIQLQLMPHETRRHPGLSGPFRVMAFQDRPPLAYAEHMMGGELVDDVDQVRESGTIFGALQAEAMSPTASGELIRAIHGEFDA